METKDLTEQLRKTIEAYLKWQLYADCTDGSDDMMYTFYVDEREKLAKDLNGKTWHLEDLNIGVVYTGKNCNFVVTDFIKQHDLDYCERIKLSVEA